MKERTIESLRREAASACKFRGHKMCWIPTDIVNSNTRGTCKLCGMLVDLKTHPAPNEINIGGEAVALTCKIPKYRVYDYDVWGNEKSGYEVNNVFKTSTVLEIPYNFSNKGIIKKLKEAGFIIQAAKNSKFRIDGEPDATLYITWEPTEYPMCELRRVMNDEGV